jgi:hypothetical protein
MARKLILFCLKMRKVTLIQLFLFSLLLSCSNYQPTSTHVGAAGGTALGAGLGALVGSQVGNAAGGALLGAATGGAVGGFVGYQQDELDKRSAEQDEVLSRQRRELQRQQKEVEDLRRQRYYDDKQRELSNPSSFNRELETSAPAVAQNINKNISQASSRAGDVPFHADTSAERY